MKSNYDACLRKVFEYEGGYTNDKADPGGPTNWGITIYDARLYWKKDATAADVHAMPKSVAADIYRKRYWDKMSCDDDPAGVDLCTFDAGVNSGVGRGVMWRNDTATVTPVADRVKRMCALRLSFLHALRTWSVFGKGWGRRVADVEATGVKMALGSNAAPVLKQEAAKAKAQSKKDTTKAAGTAAAPASTQVHSVPHHVDITSLNLTSKIGIVIAVVIVAGIAVYFIWNAVHNYHRAAAYSAAAQEA